MHNARVVLSNSGRGTAPPGTAWPPHFSRKAHSRRASWADPGQLERQAGAGSFAPVESRAHSLLSLPILQSPSQQVGDHLQNTQRALEVLQEAAGRPAGLLPALHTRQNGVIMGSRESYVKECWLASHPCQNQIGKENRSWRQFWLSHFSFRITFNKVNLRRVH